ncbi:MAG: T9SS type A sorting domain-containing protein, partial [Flavobacteriales bacterium]
IGATASSYTPLSNTSGTLYYYCIVSGTAPCGPSTSSVSGLFTVNPAAGAVTVSPLSVTACGSQLLQANIVTNDNIYWQGTTSNGTSTATQLSSQTVNSSGTYYFRAQTALGCWGPQGSATVTINTPVNITQQPNPTGSQVCSNQPLNALSVSANPNGVTYQWYANAVNSNIGGTPLAGATSPIFTPQNATSGTTYYYCLVNGLTACPNIASNVSPITIYPLPPVDAGNNIAICSGSTIALNATGAPSLTWSGGYQNGVPFIPGSTQMYYVTGVGANQCVKLDSVLITVNSNPIINAGNDITVCSGNAITLNATGALAYSWNNGVVNGAPFIPLVSSVYLVTGTNANGCQGNDMLTVIVNASPQVSGGANQSVCSGNQVILTGTGASTYTWNNNVQNNVPFTPLITQTYTVTGTATNGCTNTAHVTITLLESPNINAGDSMYICNGQEAVLWGSGAEVLTWNPTAVSGVPFIPNSSGYFYLTGYNANGCSAVDSVYIMVSNENYAQPIDLEILGVNVLYAVDSTLDYYQWGYNFNGTSVLTCAGAHYCYFPDFNPAIKEYWLDHGNSGECYRRTYYNQMNTLNETEFDEIEAIPVPFTSYLTIQTDYEQDYLIEIYSVQGELILKCNFYDDSLTLPTDNWNKGTYIIKIHHLSGSNSILVVK